MMSLLDEKSFYGKYVSKKEPVVFLEIARQIERKCHEESAKYRIAQGAIDRAHLELDHLKVPRKQRNSKFSLSLAGRLRFLSK